MRRALPLLLGLGALTTLGAGAPNAPNAREPKRAETSAERPPRDAPCPANQLPDDGVCVRLPDDEEGAPAAETAVGSHRDRRGDWIVYDQIPRRPDRPADYDAYEYPVPCPPGCVFSGYDLDRSDDRQRRGPRLRHVGHGGLDIDAAKGTPVVLTVLEHQEQAAAVVYVGPLFGTTVVTRHTVREAGVLHDYVVLFGHLDAPGPRLLGAPFGTPLQAGEVVGFVGDTGSSGLVHLHLEVRRVRQGIDLSHLSPSALVDDSATVVCDPRNVLPRK
jgi:murein DD-endopeptidase MepM/ murein hydrolase activator NlpD